MNVIEVIGGSSATDSAVEWTFSVAGGDAMTFNAENVGA
jgi:pyocin large subunit-like protein